MKMKLALLLLVLGGVVAGIQTQAQAGSPGWIVQCTYSHSLMDDPIVYPGQPGKSHLHDFLGSKSTNAYSTYQSMRSSATTCPASAGGDTAGYWIPALYEDGKRILPAGTGLGGRKVRIRFYYRKAGSGPVTPFPANFKMIAGNPGKANEIYWGCSDNSTGKQSSPPQCPGTGIITLHVGFPSCWDGRNLDSPDHRSHMAYPSSGKCPSTHPVRLPRLIERFEWPVGSSTGRITLSSGAPSTAHADFWNTWNQSRLEQLTRDCLNANVDCGAFAP